VVIASHNSGGGNEFADIGGAERELSFDVGRIETSFMQNLKADCLQDPAHWLTDRFRQRRRPHRQAVSDKQFVPKDFAQFGQRIAHHRLADLESLRRELSAPHVVHGVEDLQQIEVDLSVIHLTNSDNLEILPMQFRGSDLGTALSERSKQ
jgi:hypothetical protein